MKKFQQDQKEKTEKNKKCRNKKKKMCQELLQTFTKNICTDFKSIFSDYLTRLLKTKK